jgi:hypothetical protein
MLTLTTMTTEEANGFGIEPTERRRHFRLDGAKSNYAAPVDAEWWRLDVVQLDNDEAVAAAVPWKPPTPWEGLSNSALLTVLRKIMDAPDNDLWCAKKQAGERWAGQLLIDHGKRSEIQAANILVSWERSGLLRKIKFTNADSKERYGYRVDPKKYSEMQNAFGSPENANV